MSSVLDKVWVECLMPLEYKYLHHVLLNLGYSIKKSLQVVIASLRVTTGAPPVPGHGTSPCQNDKTNKQNGQSHNSFIYYGYIFLFRCASLKNPP